MYKNLYIANYVLDAMGPILYIKYTLHTVLSSF